MIVISPPYGTVPALNGCWNQENPKERGSTQMADKKDFQGEFSTCFEKLPFAEMMQKMMRRSQRADFHKSDEGRNQRVPVRQK